MSFGVNGAYWYYVVNWRSRHRDDATASCGNRRHKQYVIRVMWPQRGARGEQL